jgi:hypothetical protein
MRLKRLDPSQLDDVRPSLGTEPKQTETSHPNEKRHALTERIIEMTNQTTAAAPTLREEIAGLRADAPRADAAFEYGERIKGAIYALARFRSEHEFTEPNIVTALEITADTMSRCLALSEWEFEAFAYEQTYVIHGHHVEDIKKQFFGADAKIFDRNLNDPDVMAYNSRAREMGAQAAAEVSRRFGAGLTHSADFLPDQGAQVIPTSFPIASRSALTDNRHLDQVGAIAASIRQALVQHPDATCDLAIEALVRTALMIFNLKYGNSDKDEFDRRVAWVVNNFANNAKAARERR